MIVAMKHEKRRFVEHVDFITSPGYLRGGDTRRRSGLLAGGTFRVVTDLAVFGFERRAAAHAGDLAQSGRQSGELQDNTGFRLDFARRTGVTEPPTDQELELLRELDPDRLYTGSMSLQRCADGASCAHPPFAAPTSRRTVLKLRMRSR
jgi:glutaconate CoA-transferase subunit B